MEARVQQVLVWSGPLMLIMWVGAFLVFAGFIPPSDPAASADIIVKFYSENTTGIRVGLVIAMAGCALLVPFGVALSGQLKRIDGAKALSDTQMVSCALLSLEFITPIAMWLAVSYRFDDRGADVTRALHDMGWIVFMTVIWSFWIQLIAVGTAILIDRKPKPTLPRWSGYLSFWVALLIMPAGMVAFFKGGPFAWDGIIGIYTPLGATTIWYLCMSWVVHRNLSEQIAEGTEPA